MKACRCAVCLLVCQSFVDAEFTTLQVDARGRLFIIVYLSMSYFASKCGFIFLSFV